MDNAVIRWNTVCPKMRGGPGLSRDVTETSPDNPCGVLLYPCGYKLQLSYW